MDVKTMRAVMQQRVTESPLVVHAGLCLLAAAGFARAALGKQRGAVDALSQVHRTARWQWMIRLVEPYIVSHLDAVRQAPKPPAEDDLTRYFGNRLAVLKAPGENGEKGVLFVMTSAMFQRMYDGMDVPRLLRDYTLVFEPSWSGYCHPEMLRWTQWPDAMFVAATEERDFSFLTRLGSNLVPLRFGASDWVDPRVSEPYLDNPKEFDIVMNANWGAFKRHHVLFRMMSKARRRFRVLLIGVEWNGKTSADIERLARYYGVADQVTIIENIPYAKVMDLTCRSRVAMLLSLKEGSNRSIPEGIFCNLPVVVLKSNIGGIRKDVTPETGLLVDESGLEDAVTTLLSSDLQPRAWGMAHVSCFKTSELLNTTLREHALAAGKPWRRDIAGRSNSPDSKYLYDEDEARLRPWNERLKDYLVTAR